MTTTPLGSSLSPSPAPSTSSASNPYNLTSADFVKMMITQLQNQDPLQPESNDQLMSQMNQIGQLQSNSMMQDTLKGLGLQTQIGSASSLIGKMVEGMDQNNNTIRGLVNSVKQRRQSGAGQRAEPGPVACDGDQPGARRGDGRRRVDVARCKVRL